MAEDLWTVEEREGPSNRPREGRKTMSELQGDKIRAVQDTLQKRREEFDNRRAELGALLGEKLSQVNRTVRVKPSQQFSLKGVNTEAGGRITEETEVEITQWISRRIRDGSLEVVGNGNGNGNGEARRARRAAERLAAEQAAQQPQPEQPPPAE